MISVDALLFDLDGTLIDSGHDIAESVRKLQAAFDHAPSPDRDVAAWIGDGIDTLVERALPGLDHRRLPDAVETLKQTYAEHCLDTTRLYPDVMPVLAHFRAKPMAVVTNKPERISRRILEALGVAEYFPVIIGGNTYRVKKPHPEPLRKALERLGGISPARAVMVGDGENDVRAGRAAGLLTAGLYSTISHGRRKSPHHADVELETLSELMRFFN